jgi:hypothetical protein
MLKYAEALVRKKFSTDISSILQQSRLLDQINKQRTLRAF